MASRALRTRSPNLNGGYANADEARSRSYQLGERAADLPTPPALKPNSDLAVFKVPANVAPSAAKTNIDHGVFKVPANVATGLRRREPPEEGKENRPVRPMHYGTAEPDAFNQLITVSETSWYAIPYDRLLLTRYRLIVRPILYCGKLVAVAVAEYTRSSLINIKKSLL